MFNVTAEFHQIIEGIIKMFGTVEVNASSFARRELVNGQSGKTEYAVGLELILLAFAFKILDRNTAFCY